MYSFTGPKVCLNDGSPIVECHAYQRGVSVPDAIEGRIAEAITARLGSARIRRRVQIRIATALILPTTAHGAIREPAA